MAKAGDCNSPIGGSTPPVVLNKKKEEKKNDISNDKTNFIKIAADQPKLVYLEWIKKWVLSDLAIK